MGGGGARDTLSDSDSVSEFEFDFDSEWASLPLCFLSLMIMLDLLPFAKNGLSCKSLQSFDYVTTYLPCSWSQPNTNWQSAITFVKENSPWMFRILNSHVILLNLFSNKAVPSPGIVSLWIVWSPPKCYFVRGSSFESGQLCSSNCFSFIKRGQSDWTGIRFYNLPHCMFQDQDHYKGRAYLAKSTKGYLYLFEDLSNKRKTPLGSAWPGALWFSGYYSTMKVNQSTLRRGSLRREQRVNIILPFQLSCIYYTDDSITFGENASIACDMIFNLIKSIEKLI